MNRDSVTELTLRPAPDRAIPRPKRGELLDGDSVGLRMLSALAAFTGGFLLGGISFPPETRPAGMALTAALPKCFLPAAAGVLFRSLLLYYEKGELPVFGVAALVIAAFRYIFAAVVYGKNGFSHLTPHTESVALRGLVAAVFSLGASLFFVLQTELALMDIVHFVVNTASTVAFTFLLAFLFEKNAQGTPAFELSICTAAFLVSLSLSEVTVRGFSVGLATAFALTLYVGYLGQPTRGAAAGLLCGLAFGGVYAPVFALAGAVAGVFFEVSSFLAAAGAVAVMFCGAVYFGEVETAIRFLPEILTAATLVALPAALHILPALAKRETVRIPAARGWDCDTLIAEKKESLREHRMAGLAGTMNELSSLLFGVSEKVRRPAPEKLTEKCLAIFDRYCRDCPMDCPCRDMTSPQHEAVNRRLASQLIRRGRLDREHLYEITKMRCPSLDEIAAEISETAGKMLAEAIREDKTEVFAYEYEAMASLFADLAAESTPHLGVDKVLSDRARRRLAEAGFSAENIVVCGDRKKYVIATGDGVGLSTMSPSALRSVLEKACGVPFGDPEYLIEQGKTALILEGKPRYAVEHLCRQESKEGESLCGDSVSAFAGEDDRFFAFLCDGMGSGREASLTAELCRIFLEKMLACGNKKSTTLDMLNHLILSKGTECFATVDMVEIDLCLGVASFVKSGAVPSYILRAGHIYKISSGTLPIGIVPKAEAELTEFELQDGDILLLCSDGVTTDVEHSEAEDPTWLLTLLGEEADADLPLLAQHILDGAERASVRSDDRTVTLLRIRALPESKPLAS